MECFLLGKGKQFSFKRKKKKKVSFPRLPLRSTFREFLNLHLKALVQGLQLLGGIKIFRKVSKGMQLDRIYFLLQCTRRSRENESASSAASLCRAG